MGPHDIAPLAPLGTAAVPSPALSAPSRGLGARGHGGTADAKLHKVAKDFEAVFLTEMLRLAKPPDKAAPGFSAGESGDTWQVFMDQALGQAAAVKGGTGLTKQIEEALRRAQAGKGTHR